MLRGVCKVFEALLATPRFLRSRNSVDYYEHLGDDVLEGEDGGFEDAAKPLWLNLGYWKTARSYPQACVAMATLVADAAGLGPGLELLDVGFGFAEQDLYWLAQYRLKKITGLNITPLHVERAQRRVLERGLESKIDLRLGSATEIPFEAGSFDAVTALECAFHFDTRERFFEEALRVLRPGGSIATADVLPAPGQGPLTFVNRMALKRWAVPPANHYDRDEYCRRLCARGFVNVRCESIRNDVFPGVTKYAELRKRGISMKDARIELTPDEIDRCLGIEDWALTGLTDYAIFSAEKPQ